MLTKNLRLKFNRLAIKLIQITTSKCDTDNKNNDEKNFGHGKSLY